MYVYNGFNMFLRSLGTKTCRIIGRLSQKVISRPNICKICEKMPIHVQGIHQNSMEINR